MEIIHENEYLYRMNKEAEPYLELHRQEKYVSNAENFIRGKNKDFSRKIHIQYYLAKNPRGVIVISHGFTEGSPKYDEMIYYFLKAGYHVYMPEHMGHGLSYRLTADPSLVHVDIWKRYVRDFLKVCREIKGTHPDLPLILFAHSMGGAIGGISASWEPGLFQKIILSSPMIRPLTGKVPWPLVVLIAHFECFFGKAQKYVAGQKLYDGGESFETCAGTSESRFERYDKIRRAHKELQTCAASYGWLLAAIKMSWYLRIWGWKKIKIPVLFFQAENDDFVSVRALKRFAGKVKQQGSSSCKYIYMPGTKHEIYCSDDSSMEKYLKQIFRFLEIDAQEIY